MRFKISKIFLIIVFTLGFGFFNVLFVNAAEPSKTGNEVKDKADKPSVSGECTTAVCNWARENYKMPEDYKKNGGAIPECAFSGTCREANDILQLFINQGKAVFGLIGMIALAAFVYGGFLMVFSFGSSDKVQQGKDVMIAAVVGIIIVFSAYLLVNFILQALGVSDEFIAIK